MNHPNLQYGSVCSGIEAVSLAWKPLGWHPAWFSEIDPFPNAVLAHHYPDVPNLGDMTGIADQILAGTVPAPDILVGGTPCQAFSVAGARGGLSDPRGALTLKYTELANAIDQTRQQQHQQPSVIVWENVPGVLSDKSNAFGCLLGALAGESRELQPAGAKWTNAGCVSGPRRSIAWRVLDAQYFGVAQRRKRVFLVASGRDGFDPAAVLFEPDCLHGDSSPGEQTWQIAAGPFAGSPDGAGSFPGSLAGAYQRVSVTVCFGGGNRQGPIDKAACLTARGHKCDFEVETFAAQSVTGQQTHALNTANGGKGSSEDGTGRGVPIVTQLTPWSAMPVAFAQNSRNEVRLEAGDGQIVGALSVGGGKPGQGLPAIAYVPARNAASEDQGDEKTPMLGFTAQGSGADVLENLAPTLRAGGHADSHANAGVVPAIVFKTLRGTFNYDISGTLISHYSKRQENADTILGPDLIARSVAVRGREGGATAELGGAVADALRASGGGSDKAHVLLPSFEAYFRGELLPPDESGWSQWACWRVRRLMPVECERLQGMPDNYTLVPYRGKPAADAPRYKAIGNSMAVPCVAWLGQRLSIFMNA
ncbi:DNA cytosine methyltransferase [Erwinia sp. S43]|uniref:DNA cytosine methyltransferase n=1 Tax=Erwinia sp. S43 TaxID=2769339 RepID=UPI001F492662|nr:DNA cytosine methyltransferase [Erwinia sp. S43]MBK0032658.1 DNA cytosine methyltransferase [Erwinia sp. S43]